MSSIANIKTVISNVHLFTAKCNSRDILIGFPYA